MKICVYGAGAIGCLLGASLAQHNNSVSVVARGDTYNVIKQSGIGVRDGSETHYYPVRVVDDPQQLEAQDLVILSVKNTALEQVLPKLRPLLQENTKILFALNGLQWWFFDFLQGPLEGAVLHSIDPDAQYRNLVATQHILGCVLHFSCYCPQPGVVQKKMGNRIIIGQPDKQLTDASRGIIASMKQTDFDVEVAQNIQADIWYKLLGNMTMNPISALTRTTTDIILKDKVLRQFSSEAMLEAQKLGGVFGCPAVESIESRIEITLELGAMRTSMYYDALASKPLEVEALIGVVSEIGKKLNIATPYIDTLYSLTKILSHNLR